ncbi:MAG: putative lipid II flippase FtsW [Nitrospirae bacterium]|nr:putative lipid II flippase FtsW [Nitrospirota bacterium]
MIAERHMNPRNTKSIFIPVIMLISIGVVMVYSSTALLSANKFGSSFHYLSRHLFTVAAGFAVMLFMSKIDYQKMRAFGIILLITSFILLILVFIPGIGLTANGARRWINLRVITFQPSELAKIAMVFFLADYMDKNSYRMKEFRYGIVYPVLVMLFFQGIIIVQPDFGAVMSLAVLTVGLLFLGGAPLKRIGLLMLAALPAVYFLVVLFPYRLMRLLCFLDPWEDSLGCGFQLVQSFIAFGNGGITGLGIGGSKQKLFFLPEAHTDFILSLIGEELGLIGIIFVLALFIWFFVKGVKVALDTDDLFSYYLSFGLTIMIISQAVINFSVSTGLMPTKGLPLPFISYGGSALLINMAAVGVLINISMRNHQNRIERRRRPEDASNSLYGKRGA